MKRLIYVVPLWLTIGVVHLEATDVKDIGWKASGKGGAVAAGGAEAVAAGIQLLEAGGNAADDSVGASAEGFHS